MKSKTKLLIVVPFILLLLVPNVLALTAIWSMPWVNHDGDWTFNPGEYVGVIVTGNDAYLHSAAFALENGTLIISGDGAILYVYPVVAGDIVDGTSPLEASNTLDLYELGGYTTLYWNFSGTTFLVNQTDYAVVVQMKPNTSGHLHLGYDADGDGMIYSVDGIHWSTAGNEPCGTVWTTNEYGTGEGSGWSSSDADELIDDAVAFLVPVIVMLLPALLFIIFFKRTDKWLILIGLAIGVGLGYYFFNIPVWLVFLVAIGLIGFAYSEVRRNG